MSNASDDPRIDPRLKAMLAAVPTMESRGDVESREALLAETEAQIDEDLERMQAFFGGQARLEAGVEGDKYQVSLTFPRRKAAA